MNPNDEVTFTNMSYGLCFQDDGRVGVLIFQTSVDKDGCQAMGMDLMFGIDDVASDTSKLAMLRPDRRQQFLEQYRGMKDLGLIDGKMELSS